MTIHRVREGRPRKFHVCRFEQLEGRHLLSAGNANSSVFSLPISISNELAPAAVAPAIANLAITTDPSVQQMPSVAVDPHDPNHVVIAYMDYSLVTTGYAGLRVAVSDDAGASWQYSSIPLPAGFEQGAANPTVKFDDQGHVFVSFMAQTYSSKKPPITNPTGINPETRQAFSTYGFTSANGIFEARSDDGGTNWNTTAVATQVYDGTTPVPYERMPDLAIDTDASSPNFGNLYVVWARYYPKGQFPGEPD